ncbi:MAG TPA: diguanylate cyclase, partial [Bradyrhizobium sp.]
CLAIAGLSEAVVTQLVEQIRLAVSDVRTWLPSRERTTVSIGFASLGNEPCTLTDLVARADAALYAAKSGGRNRVVNWKDIAQDPELREADKPAFLAR